MKQLIVKSMMAMLMALLSLNVSAYDAEVNGIYYNFNYDEMTADVTSGDNEYSGDIVIPSSITWQGATYSVTSISDGFRYRHGITSVTLPNSVTNISATAFEGCSGLTSPVYNSKVFAYMPTSYEGAYTIPDGITTICEWAFRWCYGLTSVTIPNSVTYIGQGAFSECSHLFTSVFISKNVVYIGPAAFQSDGVENIVVEEGNPYFDSRDNCNAIIRTTDNELVMGCKNTTIPDDITSIGEDAFWGCSGLTSIAIPNSVTSIGWRAFYGCNDLTSPIYNSKIFIQLPPSYKGVYTIPEGIATIGTTAFNGCQDLTSVVIPNSVTTIGVDAFYFCPDLESLTIPSSVTTIERNAFFGCGGLTSINVESGNSVYDSRDNCNAIIETSSNTLIRGCSNTSIPNSVMTIGDHAFHGCNGLTSVTIPNSVTFIGESAFGECI